MKRRAAVAVLAAFAASPRAAWPQRVRRIGTLIHGEEKNWSGRVAALKTGLKDLGYLEGKDYVLVSRGSGGRLDLLPGAAAELLREKPEVVVCGPVISAAALQKAGGGVPVVIGAGAGAVKIGLAKSYARPGGNVTGLESQAEEIHTKQLEFLRTIAPRATRVAVLNTDKYLFNDEAWQALKRAAPAMKLELVDLRVGAQKDLARLESSCGSGGCDALYVMTDPDLVLWRAEIIARAARLRLPAVYPQPEYAEEGGLLSYSANFEDMWRRAASYVDRILKGARPADLPMERPSKFELVINLKTGKALGLTVPGHLVARADRVIR